MTELESQTKLKTNTEEKSENVEQFQKTKQRQLMREELKCSICFDLFRHPVSLPGCGHTFCCVCIEAFLEHSHPPSQQVSAGGCEMTAAFVHCPLCRKASCITRKGPEWLLVENRIATNMVTILNEQSQQCEQPKESRSCALSDVSNIPISFVEPIVVIIQPHNLSNESEQVAPNPEDQIIRARNSNACTAYLCGFLAMLVANPLCLLLCGIGYIIKKCLPPRVGSSYVCFWIVLIIGTLVLVVGLLSYCVLLPLVLSPIYDHNRQNGITSTTTTLASSLSNYNFTNIQWNSNSSHGNLLLPQFFGNYSNLFVANSTAGIYWTG